MDELLLESGVSYDELYKLHTGHHVNKESDDSDSSDTGSLDEDLKPPPYSFDEIKNAQTPTANNENSNIVQAILESDDISKKLSLSITANYCFICMNKSKKHYIRPKHYRNVRQWLQKELAKISAEVKLNYFFCEVCNLALCGNDLAQRHYQSGDHRNKAKKFCLPCLRPISACDMPVHLKSKKHETDSLKNSPLLDTNMNIEQGPQESKSTIPVVNIENEPIEEYGKQVNNELRISDTKDESIKSGQKLFYTILDANGSNMFTANNDLGKPNEYKTLTEYGELANIIMDIITPSFCYICNMTVQGSHYNSRDHNTSLEMWIDSYARSCGWYIKNIDDLICFACHAVFPKKKYAEIHYMSSGHLSKSRSFCNVCLQHLVGTKAEAHDTDPEHISQVKVRKIEKEREQKMIPLHSQMINSSKIIVPQNSGLNIHGIDVNVIRAIIGGKRDKTTRCDPVAKSILELMTPTYCFICNKSALKNNKGHFRHYTYVTHQTELKKLLHNEEKNGDFDHEYYESVYCEACNEIFLNNKLAEQHYNSSEHKGNCEICLINGSNMHIREGRQRAPLLLQNEKTESKVTNSRIPENGLIKTDSVNKEPIYRNLQTNNKENFVISPTEDQPGSIITDKLTDMLSPVFCYICKKNVNMHIFNHHYLERDHTIKLRNWLSNEVKKSGVIIDLNCLYCEDCSLELGGTNEDLKHYETVGHQLNKKRYCSVCIFRGTALDVTQHISAKQHRDNSKKLLNNAKKGNEYPSWPQKLTNLITLNECKVCCVKLQTTEKADFHYCSEMHNTNVRMWLDRYNQGDNAVSTANGSYKVYSCTFCERSFTFEQELNDHKNTHFPSLGGTNESCADASVQACAYTRGHKPKTFTTKSRKPKTTPEPEKKEVLLEKIAIDKPILSTPAEQQVIQSLVQQTHNGNSNENDDKTNMHKEIRIEIDKLINTIYFLKPLPSKESLRHLKELNKKLTAYKTSTVQDEKICQNFKKLCANNELTNKTKAKNSKTKRIILSSPSTSHNDEIPGWEFLKMAPNHVAELTEQEYVKTKLSMEIQRLKMVVGNKSKVPADIAFKYVQNLNQLLENLINSGSREVNIDGIFEANKSIFITATLQGNFQDELNKLCDTLSDTKRISVEVALDFITQFNVQLESFLQYKEGNDPLYFDLSDY